jgi:trigger factor
VAVRSVAADLEGKTLSSADTLDNNSETPETAHNHDHDHEGHQHEHGPALNPDCTRELVIDVPAEEVAKTYKAVAANYRKYARIPGFRTGKVPESIVRKRFATEIRKEVIDALLPERFNKGVMELGIRPVGQPQVAELSVEDGAPLHVKAVFEYLSDFSIDGYKDIVVPKPVVEVTDEEVNKELEQIRDARSTMEPVEEDRAIADGDWAQIAYKGQVEGLSDDEAVINGEDTLIEVGGQSTVEAFTTALRGAKKGQEIKAEVTYPPEYGEPRFAGKTVTYEITVKGIKKRVLSELNDDFAKEFGRYQTFAELEADVRNNLTNRKKRAAETETKDKLLGAISEKFTFPVPESLVQDQIDTRLERGLRALAAQGMDPAQMRGMDFPRLRAAQRDNAVTEVKYQILLDRIAEAEEISVGDEEVDRELAIASMQTGEPLDALKSRLSQEGGIAAIRVQMRRDKAAKALYERLPG